VQLGLKKEVSSRGIANVTSYVIVMYNNAKTIIITSNCNKITVDDLE